MAFKSLKIRITGDAPLLMHNGQSSDPLNPFAQAMKKVSGKRQKTEDDYRELARIEFLSGMYLKDKKPCIPGFVFESCLVSAAKKTKRGKLALAGMFVPDDSLLEYSGAKDIDKLYQDDKFRLTTSVRIQNNRVMRTRPKFDEWAVKIEIKYDPKVLNESDVIEIAKTAGDVGLCDWRPKFGRFSVEIL